MVTLSIQFQPIEDALSKSDPFSVEVARMSRLSRCILLVAWVGVLLQPMPGTAQVVLKPNGQNAIPLHTKSIQAEVILDHQVASARLTLTFQNTTSDRIEADFIYTLPPDTRVTSFAYWYGQEKVPARIMEKAEAAAIYAHITSRMRDPALVELVGKNTFRARIFPVMPNSDLRVEMTLAQTLPSEAKGASYLLPLLMPKGEALDSIQVNVRVKPETDLTDVTSNYGLPIQHRHDGYLLTLSGSNYRPEKDLRVSLHYRSPRLRAALYAARAISQDGYFALVMTPDRTLTQPKVTISGVTTYQVVPTTLPGVKAHQALTLFGRYHGSGRATVTLTGRAAQGAWTATHAIQFGVRRDRSNPAARLWAAQRIEQLGTARRNRAAIITLSRQYGIPSRYTSWLAVPKAEMKRYEDEINEAKIEAVGGRLVQVILDGHARSRQARQLRSRLNALCHKRGEEPSEVLQSYLSGKLADLGETLSQMTEQHQEKSREGRHLHTQVQRLARALKMNTRELNDYIANYQTTEVRTGDPLLSIEAPADAQQVVALLPGGEVKRLAYDAHSGRWEARFDIPTYAAEGDFAITVIIVRKDGTRQTLVVHYHVDLTPPTGAGRARIAAGSEPTLRLELNAGADIARVKALLPWGAECSLRPSAQPHSFFGLVPIPSAWRSAPAIVTFVLTDKAHNRTVLHVDMTAQTP
jgi:hypothetical protein